MARVKNMRKEIDELRDKRMALLDETESQARQLGALREDNRQLLERLQEEQNHSQVLLSDRDRLTATIEILSRRLASPLAERLLARAGWRANILVSSGRNNQLEPMDQKSERIRG